MCKIIQIMVHVIAIYSLLWGVDVVVTPTIQAYQERVAQQEVQAVPVKEEPKAVVVPKAEPKQEEPKENPPVFLDWASSFEGAIQQGKDLNRPVVAVWSITGCHPCELLKKNILPHPDIAPILAERYVLVVLRDSPRAKQYGVNRYPRITMIMPNGKWKTDVPGNSPMAFRSQLIKLSTLLK
jgi:hypothetical protein